MFKHLLGDCPQLCVHTRGNRVVIKYGQHRHFVGALAIGRLHPYTIDKQNPFVVSYALLQMFTLPR